MSSYGLVRRLGRVWVRVYTSGLPDEVRERRRDEIDCDLYEQERAALIAGQSALLARPVASRFVRGAPADVTWRIGHELAAVDEHDLSASWPGRLALALVLAIAVVSLVYAILHAFGAIPNEPRYYAFVQLGLMFGALIQLGGFSASRRAPLRGAIQILIPGLIMALMWVFMPPIAIAVLAVTAYGMFRAVRFWQEGSRTPLDMRASRRPPA